MLLSIDSARCLGSPSAPARHKREYSADVQSDLDGSSLFAARDGRSQSLQANQDKDGEVPYGARLIKTGLQLRRSMPPIVQPHFRWTGGASLAPLFLKNSDVRSKVTAVPTCAINPVGH